MVEQDPVARIHPVRLAVISDYPKGVELGASVGRPGVERGCLTLRGLHDLAVQLGRRRLVEPHMLLEPAGTDGVEQPQRAQPVDVPSVLGHFKGDLDVRLRAEVVNLRGLDLGDDVHEVGAVAEIAVVQLELVGPWGTSKGVRASRTGRRTFMLIFVEMVQTTGVEARRTANDAVHLVAFGEQEFRSVARRKMRENRGSCGGTHRYEPSWPVIPEIIRE